MSTTTRTLPPLEFEPFLFAAWRAWQVNPISPAIVESAVDSTTGQDRPIIRRANPHEYSGIFELTISEPLVKLRLNPERCSQEVHSPRRPGVHLTNIQRWCPVRVIVNGKGDWHDERYFYVQDYHVVVVDSEIPKELSAVQSFDLQADLY